MIALGQHTSCCAILVALSASAMADAPSVCVHRSAPVAGLDTESLELAQRLERRVDPRALALVDDDTPCDSTRAVLELNPELARVSIGGVPEATLPLSAIGESDRATVVLRFLRDTFAPEAEVPVLEDDLPTLAKSTAEPVTAVAAVASTGASLRGYLALGGDWTWESEANLHSGEVHLEGGLTFLDDALLVGLRLGFEPPADVELTRVSTTVSAIPLTATVRGGWRLGPIDLALGAGIGVEWRSFDVAPTHQSIRRSDTVTSSFVEGEVEVSAAIARWLRVGAFGGARRFLTWTDIAWDGELAYATPRLSALAGLRVTALFGGEHR